MENRINQIITLNNDLRFFVLDQGFIEDKNYFLVSEIDKEDNLTNKFNIFEQTTGNDELDVVLDADLLDRLAEYFKIRLQYV